MKKMKENEAQKFKESINLKTSATPLLSEVVGGRIKKITFGGGCFWCVESCFNMLKGVETAVSGYCGGTKENPAYKEVCTGETGHAEVVQITYNPEMISFHQLLEVFFFLHDPTQLNRQGDDIGTQYRSVIFYNNEEEKTQAE
jgi:peptide-methionine (S)-S-oxide reductase